MQAERQLTGVLYRGGKNLDVVQFTRGRTFEGLTRKMIGGICLQMADPKCCVVLYLGDKRAGPTAPVPGFHIEFLVLKTSAEGELAYTLNFQGVRIIVRRAPREEPLKYKKRNEEKNVGSLNFIKGSVRLAYKRKGPRSVRRNNSQMAVLRPVTKNQLLFFIFAKARWDCLLNENQRGLYSPNQRKCHSGVLTT